MNSIGGSKRAAAFAALLVVGQVASAQAALPAVKPHKPAAVLPSPAVRAVAAHPDAHLGRLSLSGVVGIATPGKGLC